MTLNELQLIHSILINFASYDCCYEALLTDNTNRAIQIIERELELKTMDPRKRKEDDNLKSQ